MVIEFFKDENGNEYVCREVFYNNKLKYTDVLNLKEYIASLDRPDIFRMAELFVMNFIQKDCLTRIGDFCIWNLRRERINRKLYRPSLLERFTRWIRRIHPRSIPG